MNQILVTKNYIKKIFSLHVYLFIFSIIIILLILFFKFNLYLNQLKYDKVSKDMQNIYNLERIYMEDNYSNYSSIKLSNGISIAGVIQIPKINLEYPIINNSTDNLLKISVCKFSGPNPNELGNFSIIRT